MSILLLEKKITKLDSIEDKLDTIILQILKSSNGTTASSGGASAHHAVRYTNMHILHWRRKHGCTGSCNFLMEYTQIGIVRPLYIVTRAFTNVFLHHVPWEGF